MRVIFDKRILEHAPNCPIEGRYRFQKFEHSGAILKGNEHQFLVRLHGQPYLENVINLCNRSVTRKDLEASPGSYQACLVSTRVVLDAVRDNSFGITRPAGHHAFKNGEPRGLCFFNNMGVAINELLSMGEKVLILDFDAHHGDGTQNIVQEETNVFYFSFHQDNLWPYSGGMNDNGKNYLNLPIPPKTGDESLQNIMDLFERIVSSFSPTRIAISAGFDGYHEDKLAQLGFTERGYEYIGSRIGKIGINSFALLEGGYHRMVYECTQSLIRGINEKKILDLPTKTKGEIIERVKCLESLLL